ncbi:LexA family transcriptional regulator [Riemerella columbipharyngis]|uniref:Peptidase S24-like n=1 Tax=Riemerella columbipharyngis TaxID=1071918 RepID=A0A1G7CLI2_9FLAO|nr:LexA family transcriptional regulator [Riemerella columbipharyngis]SDE40081.1 Peptidase S24-like [Riemerella columbipharyngis]
MSNFIDKSLILNKIKKEYNFNSDTDFAKFLGIKPQTMSSWHSRNTFDTDLIYAKCENLNADFLLSGKGDVKKPNVQKKLYNKSITQSITESITNQMFKKGYTSEKEEKTKSAEKVNKKNVDLNVDQNVTKPNVQKKLSNGIENENVSFFNEEEVERGVKLYKSGTIEESPVGIPLIPIEAMAGFGEGEIQVMDYETSNYVIPEFTELKADFMIRIKGNSMYPKYSSGDLVACKKLFLRDIFFQWNKVYVLNTEQGALIKRIHQSTVENCILCVSDNESYKPFDLPLEQVYSIAIVVGGIRFE